MADYPREPSSDQQIRVLQEQVRRLWTRISPEPDYSTYAFQIADFFNVNDGTLVTEGWTWDSPPRAQLMRTGNLVTIHGFFAWQGASATYAPSNREIIRPNVIPAEFRPAGFSRFVLQSAQDLGGPSGYIYCYMETSGYTYADDKHGEGGPGPTTIEDATAQTFVALSATYPLVATT